MWPTSIGGSGSSNPRPRPLGGAGLELLALWRKRDDPDEIFFLFSVESVERARAFVEAPQAGNAGEEAGVLEGEIHFLDPPVDRR